MPIVAPLHLLQSGRRKLQLFIYFTICGGDFWFTNYNYTSIIGEKKNTSQIRMHTTKLQKHEHLYGQNNVRCVCIYNPKMLLIAHCHHSSTKKKKEEHMPGVNQGHHQVNFGGM
jgi:hypothetical protein